MSFLYWGGILPSCVLKKPNAVWLTRMQSRMCLKGPAISQDSEHVQAQVCLRSIHSPALLIPKQWLRGRIMSQSPRLPSPLLQPLRSRHRKDANDPRGDVNGRWKKSHLGVHCAASLGGRDATTCHFYGPCLPFLILFFQCRSSQFRGWCLGVARCGSLGACMKLCWDARQLHEPRGPTSIGVAPGVPSAEVSRHDRPEMAEQSEPVSPPQARHTHPGLGFASKIKGEFLL